MVLFCLPDNNLHPLCSLSPKTYTP